MRRIFLVAATVLVTITFAAACSSSDSSESGSATTSGNGSAGSQNAFCDALGKYQTDTTNAPEDLAESDMTKLTADLEAAQKVAPSDAPSDVTSAISSSIDALKSGDSDELNKGEGTIADYLNNNC